MLPLITKTIKHVIPTIVLIALTVLICFPSKINLLPRDCRVILADPAEIPYHVSIEFNTEHHCSGCLINSKHVLTAADCVDNPIAENVPDPRMKVVMGTRKLPGGISHDVNKVFLHPYYDHFMKDCNIAVVRLEKEASESKYVKYINLPKAEQKVHAGQRLVVSGFGPMRIHKPIPWYLKKIPMKVVDDKTCEKHFPYQAWLNNFCAILRQGYAGCQAEPGSPATVNRQYIIGIFSDVSKDGCDTRMSILFTYVPHYLDFIQNVTSTSP